MSKRFTKMMAAVCAAVLVLFSSAVKAENDADYRKYADGVRKEVYAMPMPEFSNPKIPDELKNKSSVVMARYTDVSVGKFRNKPEQRCIAHTNDARAGLYRR